MTKEDVTAIKKVVTSTKEDGKATKEVSNMNKEGVTRT